MKVGTRVGARRWPLTAQHPDTWARPQAGTVLAVNDVRVWEGSLAFDGRPTQRQVDAHLEWMAVHGLSLKDQVPVLWHFPDRERVLWERRATLRSYDADLVEWFNARGRARGVLKGAAWRGAPASIR